MRPMLASRGTSVPSGPEWVHEVKWDGMRVLVDVRSDAVRAWSRNENDVTVSFPELTGLARLGRDLLLDGEVVAMAAGVPTFAALADRMHVSSARRAQALAESNPVTLIAFDLLRLDGNQLVGEPLSVRRAELESLGLSDAAWQVPATYEDGQMLLDATERQGLEGVVSKKVGSRYHYGRRTKDWLKFPNRPVGSYVVGGWRHETDSDTRLGALLVGTPTVAGLSYRGRVGSGIAGRVGPRLKGMLEPLRADASPFCDEVPRVDATGTVWVRPEVVVDVRALGVTDGSRLRQPSYQGVRSDLSPADLSPDDLSPDSREGGRS
ncbi:MAG: DNA_ligase_IV_Ku-like [uncultured Nocardioidaceae bacterium]|uniref:DNA ligase (ATP) n=1 Tax=uncultured Nocardioidaceae bacterium TaxID=253824 RepID=A0A6J4LPI7_9ACTN|nr:MAG: DNA_ligase_IV_Ku-like [uncultured Nocardioidaceae bacterium]